MSNQPTEVNEADLYVEVRRMLRNQDAASMSGSLGRLIMGLAVCLGAGFLFATILAIFIGLYFDKPWISWSGWFFIYLLVVVPLLIWHDRRTRGDYLLEAAWSIESSPGVAEESIHEFGALIENLTAWIFWGPRSLIEGMRGMRGLRTWQQHAVFDRAAILVLDLRKSQSGIEIKHLVHPPEDMKIFGLTVDVLDTFGWIGKSGDGKSLWLNSTFREKLPRVGQ